jgi:hypothetical protein
MVENQGIDVEKARLEAVERLRKSIEYAYKMAMENPNLTENERKAWLNSLAYLASVLNAILREMSGKPGGEEEQDLVKLLEKIPKLAVKDEDIGALSFNALLEAFKLTLNVLRSRNIEYSEKLAWVSLLPGLITALLQYASQTGPPPTGVDEVV